MSIMILVAALAAPTTGAAQNYKILVGSHLYRVRIKGSEVKVVPKAFVAHLDADSRHEMREAAEKASGCKVEREYFRPVVLEARLICGEKAVPSNQ